MIIPRKRRHYWIECSKCRLNLNSKSGEMCIPLDCSLKLGYFLEIHITRSPLFLHVTQKMKILIAGKMDFNVHTYLQTRFSGRFNYSVEMCFIITFMKLIWKEMIEINHRTYIYMASRSSDAVVWYKYWIIQTVFIVGIFRKIDVYARTTVVFLSLTGMLLNFTNNETQIELG